LDDDGDSRQAKFYRASPTPFAVEEAEAVLLGEDSQGYEDPLAGNALFKGAKFVFSEDQARIFGISFDPTGREESDRFCHCLLRL
jgi:inactivated superfamily I helicase